ncbi:hypothetical protein BY458DRAFT_79367 [Sporodiniella umbellata]|nr:hypothetical protein BY458DRAFT_79367 [Sporodiniella umbellata]
MKNISLIVATAVFVSAISAQQHHGGIDHLDHDLGLGHEHNQGAQPAPAPVNYEIQTKPPVVLLTTVTKTKPWAVDKHHKTRQHGSEPTYDDYEDDDEQDNREHKGAHRDHDRGRFRQNVKVNSAVADMDGHLAAAAVSSSAVVYSSKVSQAISSISRPANSVVSSPSSSRSTNDSGSLRVGSAAFLVSMLAWFMV